MFRVLLADDERIALISTMHSFDWEHYGFTSPVAVTNPQEALSLLRSEHFDAAFLDIRMPELSGLDIMNQCALEGISTAFVVISGYSDFSYVQTALRLRARDYCLKPIMPEDAQRVLAKLSHELWEERLKTDPPLIDAPDALQTLVSSGRLAASGEWLSAALVRHKQPELILSQCSRLMDTLCLRAEKNALLLLSNDHVDRLLHALNELPDARVCCCTLRKKASSLARIVARLSAELEKMPEGTPAQCIRPAEGNAAFLQLLAYVDQHLIEELSLQTLAQQFHLNYTYCSELFREVTGLPFTKYLTSHRMTYAKQLLERSELSLTDIACQVGYASYHHFALTFKSHFGYSPAAYRSNKEKSICLVPQATSVGPKTSSDTPSLHTDMSKPL